MYARTVSIYTEIYADSFGTGATVQCDEGSLDDIFNNPWEQWNDSGAAGAWNSLSTSIGISGNT